MDSQRTNLYLLVSINSTRWTQKFLQPGAIFLSVYQTVHFGFSDFQLLVKCGFVPMQLHKGYIQTKSYSQMLQ
nr:hypothetical protein Iba_chr05dCG7190 [Ipomoea batatas]GMD44073.1 hypothetical protein Iba_scaffold45840CG0010 [Ipomoea batatas]